jgi:hypothetical protein
VNERKEQIDRAVRALVGDYLAGRIDAKELSERIDRVITARPRRGVDDQQTIAPWVNHGGRREG